MNKNYKIITTKRKVIPGGAVMTMNLKEVKNVKLTKAPVYHQHGLGNWSRVK